MTHQNNLGSRNQYGGLTFSGVSLKKSKVQGPLKMNIISVHSQVQAYLNKAISNDCHNTHNRRLKQTTLY